MKPNKILFGKDEFYKNLNNKEYHIFIVDNFEKEKFMIKFFKNLNKPKKQLLGSLAGQV